jgi:uncharacterized membrane protein YfcA
VDGLVLVVGGVLGGLSGSVAGLASLFSYPALLAVGVPPVGANVTNTVALSFSTLGAVVGSQPELAGQTPAVRRYAPLTVAGGAAGAGLLLATPPGTFELVVPFLVAGASAALLAQPRLQAAAARRRAGRAALGAAGTSPVVDAIAGAGGAGAGAPDQGVLGGVVIEAEAGPMHPGLRVVAGTVAVSMYAGYFGAAAGVVMLALLGAVLPESWLRVNALKNVVMGLANVVAATGFAVFGPVDWPSVVPLAAGILAGSAVGPAVARRIPIRALRIGVALAALALAVRLFLDAVG